MRTQNKQQKTYNVFRNKRPYEYTFNGYVHFFPYSWSLINTIRPKNKFIIKELNRDFIFIENIRLIFE